MFLFSARHRRGHLTSGRAVAKAVLGPGCVEGVIKGEGAWEEGRRAGLWLRRLKRDSPNGWGGESEGLAEQPSDRRGRRGGERRPRQRAAERRRHRVSARRQRELGRLAPRAAGRAEARARCSWGRVRERDRRGARGGRAGARGQRGGRRAAGGRAGGLAGPEPPGRGGRRRACAGSSLEQPGRGIRPPRSLRPASPQ